MTCSLRRGSLALAEGASVADLEPTCSSSFMRYHHLGLPVSTPLPGMTHWEHLHIWASDHQDNPFGIQFMLYEPECPVPELVRTRPHLAFVVDNLDEALVGKDVLITPNSPSAGVRVAFLVDRGEPIELLEFDTPDHPLA